jgi:outer membrane protein
MAGIRWAGVLLAGLVAPSALMGQQEITLGEAIRLAERHQPRVVQAFGTTRSSDARIRTAKGQFLPNLNVSANSSQSFSESPRVDPATGILLTSGSTSKSYSTSVSSSIDIFAGFRRTSELNSANAAGMAADASLVDVRFQQSLQTTNQFFDALSARRLVVVRELSLRRAEEQLSTSIARLAAGAATRSDSLRSLVGVGNAQLQLVTAQSQLASAEANLGRLIGATERVVAVDDTTFYQMLPQPVAGELLTEAMAQAPAVQVAEANTNAAEASLKVSKAAYWPTLTLSGNAGLSAADRTDYIWASQNNLSLGFSWQLFNRFNREQGVVQNNVALENARAQEAESRRAVVANLTTQLADLQAARLRIEITERNVEASNEDLRVQQERYRLGASTILDVLLTQEAVTQAEVDAVNARFDYLRARAAIEALIGRPL